MKIGICDSPYTKPHGLVGGLRRMKRHGYECTDYQGFVNTETPLFELNSAQFERALTEQGRIYRSEGLEISQAHAPWCWPPRNATPEERAERLEKMTRSIRGTALLGCRNFVIHPIMPWGADSDPNPAALWAMNEEFMGKLLDVAADNQVVINLENMPMRALSISSAAATLRFVKQVNSPWMRMCLDTGHCAVMGEQPGAAVRLLGKEYLSTLHIHDNDGEGDRHWLPGRGVIDWVDFAAALGEIGFEGVVSMECSIEENSRGEEPDAAEFERREIELAKWALWCAGRK